MAKKVAEHPSIAVLDFGGQYAHLIASKIRRLGAYSEICDPATLNPATLKKQYAGLIYSGGPSSVYDTHAPRCEATLLECGVPVLGICYGHQLIMQQLGGEVRRSKSREYGPARLKIKTSGAIFRGEDPAESYTVWMSHGDEATHLPDGFEILASTPDCEFAAVGNLHRNIFSLQFHPEVKHSEHGDNYLLNFIELCGLKDSWNLSDFLQNELDRIRNQVQDKKVFLLCSGGVDSTVAFALLARALPADHLRGLLVDTGFMRAREVEEVQETLRPLGVQLEVAHAASRYYDALQSKFDPEEKRGIIGQLFIDVQADAVRSMNLDPAQWFLGQGTIYPDTIESGATTHSQKIKTHHNRVPAIQALMNEGRVVEPLKELYKDEVRQLGRMLGLASELVDRHPFPGPGLAVRCLCTARTIEPGELELNFIKQLNGDRSTNIKDSKGATEEIELSRSLASQNLETILLPVRSVGVQGDRRTYAHPVALLADQIESLDWPQLNFIASAIPNRCSQINRVLLCLEPGLFSSMQLKTLAPVYLSRDRINILRRADHIVHEFQIRNNIYAEIWQFPVVLIPVHRAHKAVAESLVLRPIVSSDAMTASAYPMPENHLIELNQSLCAIDGIDLVFLDLTSKPPGTIEWE